MSSMIVWDIIRFSGYDNLEVGIMCHNCLWASLGTLEKISTPYKCSAAKKKIAGKAGNYKHCFSKIMWEQYVSIFV